MSNKYYLKQNSSNKAKVYEAFLKSCIDAINAAYSDGVAWVGVIVTPDKHIIVDVKAEKK